MNWIGMWTLTKREVGRFFSVYRQTVLPGLITTTLYIFIFGFTLQKRITEIDGFPEISYTLFILPGLIMMNTITNASSNSSSSMLQMKLLQQLPDILCAPLSSFEISMAKGAQRISGRVCQRSSCSSFGDSSFGDACGQSYSGLRISLYSFMGIFKHGVVFGTNGGFLG